MYVDVRKLANKDYKITWVVHGFTPPELGRRRGDSPQTLCSDIPHPLNHTLPARRSEREKVMKGRRVASTCVKYSGLVASSVGYELYWRE